MEVESFTLFSSIIEVLGTIFSSTEFVNPSLIFSSSTKLLFCVFKGEKRIFGSFGTEIAALILLEEEKDEGNKRFEARKEAMKLFSLDIYFVSL